LITFLILKFLGLFMKLRLSDEALETGDTAVHDEEAYPDDTLIAVGSSPPRSEPSTPAAGRHTTDPIPATGVDPPTD
jgi:Amt family ammonium transporter